MWYKRDTSMTGVCGLFSIQKNGGNHHDNHLSLEINYLTKNGLTMYYNCLLAYSPNHVIDENNWNHIAVTYNYDSSKKYPEDFLQMLCDNKSLSPSLFWQNCSTFM
jgi:hypothetical protein